MKRVIVIGSPGAGKSTFSRELSKIIKLPLYHLDMLWHKPDKTNITKLEFDAKLDDWLKRDSWIIDGNYTRTLEKRIEKCDTVFLLDFKVSVCLDGVLSRIGKKREDMPWIEEELDLEFKNWIINFPKVQLPKIYELLLKYQEKKEIIIFKTRDELLEYLKKLQK